MEDPGSDRDSREFGTEQTSLAKRGSSKPKILGKKSFADLFGMDVEDEEDCEFSSPQKFSFVDNNLLSNKFTILDTVHMHENPNSSTLNN